MWAFGLPNAGEAPVGRAGNLIADRAVSRRWRAGPLWGRSLDRLFIPFAIEIVKIELAAFIQPRPAVRLAAPWHTISDSLHSSRRPPQLVHVSIGHSFLWVCDGQAEANSRRDAESGLFELRRRGFQQVN